MKCSFCKKRTHLEFKCDCKHAFCVACRTPEVHKCTNVVKEKVVLVKVVAEKLTKLD
jgi:predicted nucleic acid binding AN1-type Zn finger protein